MIFVQCQANFSVKYSFIYPFPLSFPLLPSCQYTEQSREGQRLDWEGKWTVQHISQSGIWSQGKNMNRWVEWYKLLPVPPIKPPVLSLMLCLLLQWLWSPCVDSGGVHNGRNVGLWMTVQSRTPSWPHCTIIWSHWILSIPYFRCQMVGGGWGMKHTGDSLMCLPPRFFSQLSFWALPLSVRICKTFTYIVNNLYKWIF